MLIHWRGEYSKPNLPNFISRRNYNKLACVTSIDFFYHFLTTTTKQDIYLHFINTVSNIMILHSIMTCLAGIHNYKLSTTHEHCMANIVL